MKIRHGWKAWLARMAAGLVVASYPVCSFALVTNDTLFGPPGGWNNLCSPGSINVTPGVNVRTYVAEGTCWINVAKDKTDPNQQSWAQVKVSTKGLYNLKSNTFTEMLTFNTSPRDQVVHVVGTCADDPWATKQTCALKRDPGIDLGYLFSWSLQNTSQGPLSTLVFSPDLIQSLLSKQESKPPVAPVGLDPVRWPTNGGKSEMGIIKWRAGDMSDNKWVLQFDIEYANYVDSTFTKGGQRVGPGPKQNFSVSDANQVYVFSTPFALQTGSDYFFQVCAVNDAGRQCSAPVKARQPTKLELESVVNSSLSSVKLGKQPSNPPAASSAAREAPRVLALTSKPGGTTGTGGTGGGGTTPAAAPPRHVFGGALAGTPGGAAGSGTPGGGGGGPTPGGPAGAGPAAKPDLAVAPEGMLIDDRAMEWNASNRLVLREDASHTCPVHVSFRFTNLGKGPATNVVAEVRDNLVPAQTIATGTVPALAPGQSSTVSGIAKIMASPLGEKVTLTAIVYEKGKLQAGNVSHNHGAITLDVLCHK